MKKLMVKANIIKLINCALAIVLTTELYCILLKLKSFDLFNDRYKLQLIATIVFMIPILFILFLPHFENSFKTRILKDYKYADMALKALCVLPIIYFWIMMMAQVFSYGGYFSIKKFTLIPVLKYELLPFLIFAAFCILALVSIDNFNNKHKAALYTLGIASILTELISLFLSYEPYISRSLMRGVIVFFFLSNISVFRCTRTLFYYKSIGPNSEYEFEDELKNTNETKYIVYAERKNNNLYEVINIISVERCCMTLSINKAPAKQIHLTINEADFQEHYEEALHLAEYNIATGMHSQFGI